MFFFIWVILPPIFIYTYKINIIPKYKYPMLCRAEISNKIEKKI